MNGSTTSTPSAVPFVRTDLPLGTPCWIDLRQPDLDASRRFYSELFGWAIEEREANGPHGPYFVATLRGQDVAGFGAPLTVSTSAWNTAFVVADVAKAADQAARHGGHTLVAPFEVLGTRAAVLADAEGTSFSVWQSGGHPGAQLVNEPGTWNWSDLHTAAYEPTADFYPALFGWVLERLDLGGGGTGMWQLPGYADYLVQRDPELRERQASAAAPAGFADAIGWVVPDDRGPAWEVTFAVAGTDEAVARAVGLGAEVVEAPVDIPYTRYARVRDPQGAELTLSTFTPPAQEP